MEKYYFDYAATTPVVEPVQQAIQEVLQKQFGNAGSLHAFGHEATQLLMGARETVASFLNCSLQEVYFTSGATESNNIALQGVLEKGDHLIISAIEHPSVFEVAKALEKKGIEVTYVPVWKNLDGRVDIEALESAIKDNTRLISVMYVNNEIGVIQDISRIAGVVNQVNNNWAHDKKHILLHTDATQAAPYLSCDVQDLGVDMLSFSGHKIYGPKGIGVLYIRKGVDVAPIVWGGGQEQSIRPGTENISGIVGLAEATKYVQENHTKLEQLREWRDELYERLRADFSDITVFGAFDYDGNEAVQVRIPTNLNICFKGIEAEQLVYLLDAEGMAVSSVSACSSKALEPSRVVQAIGGTQEQARSTIRITLGFTTTKEEIDALYTALVNVVHKLRS